MRPSTNLIGTSFLAAAAIFSIIGCGGEETRVVASIQGPPAVEWVFTSEWRQNTGGGRGSLPIPTKHERAFLRIATDPPQEVDVDCYTPDPLLAVEPTRQLVAYRCGARNPWRVMHAGVPVVADPEAELGNGAEPDWTRTPALEISITRVIAEGTSAAIATRLVDRARAVGGAPAVAGVLAATAAASTWFAGHTPSEQEQEWKRIYESLPPEQAASVRADLSRALEAKDVDFRLVRNALFAFPDDDQAATAALVQAARRLTGQSHWAVAPIVRDVMRRAVASQPADAAALACAILGGSWARDDADLLVLAATGAACEQALSQVTCPRLLDGKGCGAVAGSWRLCDAAQLASRIAADLASWRRGDPPDRRTLGEGDYLLAIARAHGAVPAELEAAVRLRGYAVEQPDEPDCSNYLINQDMPCKCWQLAEVSAPPLYRDSLCQAAQEAPKGPFTTSASACRLEIDEKDRKIKVLGFKRLTGTAPPAAPPDASPAR